MHFSLIIYLEGILYSINILVFWASRNLTLNNSCNLDHFQNKFWDLTISHLWQSLNDLCHVIYFPCWKSCLGGIICILQVFKVIHKLVLQELQSLISLPTGTKIFNWLCTYLGIHHQCIFLPFPPMNFLGFNVMPRRIPSFPNSCNSWNSLSSIGSAITLLSFVVSHRSFISLFVRYTHDSSCIRDGNAEKGTDAKE